jgi:DNA recombination protein RmuC
VSNLPPIVLVIVAAAAGLVAGGFLVFVLARRWIAGARESGRAARDGEIAVLAAQRESEASRAMDLQRRVDRFERDWAAAEQNVRQLTAHAAAQQTHAERLKNDLVEACRGRDGVQQRLEDVSTR